ncbi:ABC transporter permease [Cellulomonas triticagri]|uniref:ABC transporter permease n=2 Tax=Cellulomonas triticagri TaxID=2483352 RepID=A0A3M2J278_9CELL|nr:ABC transporter permease [Cellulomonas triticagri]
MNGWQRGLVDDLDEVFRSIHSRRGRMSMLVLAVAMSVGVTVASIGIGRTAAEQIAGDLAASIQDQVTLSAATGSDGRGGDLFPPDAEARATDVPLVRTAGLRVELNSDLAPVSRPGILNTSERPPGVIAVTGGYLIGASAQSPSAWAFSTPHVQPVALVGARAAERLGLPTTSAYSGVTIEVGGRELQVIGTLPPGREQLDELVLIPYSIGVEMLSSDASARMVVTTEPGAGARVAAVLAAAVRPDAPTALSPSRVVDLAALREGVDTQLGRLTGMLGIVLTVITALLIGNTTASSVSARTAEIGLRRALGASSPMIVRLFLGEGMIVGLLGGLVGAALGCWLIVATAAGFEWTARLSPDLLALGITLGIGTGIIASAYPSSRAAQIHPAQAVRVE